MRMIGIGIVSIIGFIAVIHSWSFGDRITIVDSKGKISLAHCIRVPHIEPATHIWFRVLPPNEDVVDRTFAAADEGTKYARGWLLPWWPPHRKARQALLTAYLLAA